jgi:predicted AlkP superfamily phosphohydrolase/phosphomutase
VTLVVLGLDALDPDLVDASEYPNLTLAAHRRIDTISTEGGRPSTHELWPTIITGLHPRDHGIRLDSGGVAWSSPLLNIGARVADHILPDPVQSKVGAWMLNNTDTDVFRTPASYYARRDIPTLFDDVESLAIGVPNYVVDPDDDDFEHKLRRRIGEYMDFDPGVEHSHVADDRHEFYERCLEMVMIRIARVRRGLRSRDYALVFGYTSGIDLIGHVAFDAPALQRRAYEETDTFVGEIRADLGQDDELLIVSDHGLQEGVHTREAMVASTVPALVDSIEGVEDVYRAVRERLEGERHRPDRERVAVESGERTAADVREHLDDLGYL